MTKNFTVEAVLGVYTGRVLADRGFGEIREVLDHLFPGIMTIGCAAMQETASAEILRQHPEFAGLPEVTSQNWREWAASAREQLGADCSVEGPMAISPGESATAFAKFSSEAR